jgi:hypothetical protein
VSAQEPTSSEIDVVLNAPFFAIAASQSDGYQLRQAVSDRLRDAGLQVVVVAINSVDLSPPLCGAEIVWQHLSGGEFQRQLICWNAENATSLTKNPKAAVHPSSNGKASLLCA